MSFICFSKDAVKQSEEYAVAPKMRKVFAILFENNLVLKKGPGLFRSPWLHLLLLILKLEVQF